MTRYLAFLIAAALVAPPAGYAADAPPAPVSLRVSLPVSAPVSAAFGNTVLTIDPDGRSRKIWLQPDGSWTGLSRRGLDLAGKWTMKGDEVCLTQSKPRLFGSMCDEFPTEHDVVLETRDPLGKTVQLKLVRGRVTE